MKTRINLDDSLLLSRGDCNINLKVTESEFGASTNAKLVLIDGIVINAINSSTHHTEHDWDGWKEGFLKSLIGRTYDEVIISCGEYFYGSYFGKAYPCIKIIVY